MATDTDHAGNYYAAGLTEEVEPEYRFIIVKWDNQLGKVWESTTDTANAPWPDRFINMAVNKYSQEVYVVGNYAVFDAQLGGLKLKPKLIKFDPQGNVAWSHDIPSDFAVAKGQRQAGPDDPLAVIYRHG